MILGRATLATAGAGAAALAWAALWERRWYTLRHETLPLLRPAASRPLRVLFFSDLHLVPRQQHRLDFLRRCVAAVGPDLLVSGGDNLEDPEAITPIVELHAELRHALPGGPLPAVAVLGSHDYFQPSPGNPARYFQGPSGRPRGRRFDTPRLIAGLEEAGWQVLNNRRVCVTTAAGPVDVVGFNDPHIRYDRLDAVPWTPPGDEVALRLGVVHAPYRRVLDALDQHGYDLALAGHTHGGQLRVPLLGALVTNCDLPPRRARGSSRHGDLRLHVSAGLGHSRYAPVRFACRPEASVLDLVAAIDR